MLQALAARLTPPWSRTARNSSKRCSVSPGFIIVFTLLIQSISRLCPIHKSAQDCRYSGAFHDRCRAAARRGASPARGGDQGRSPADVPRGGRAPRRRVPLLPRASGGRDVRLRVRLAGPRSRRGGRGLLGGRETPPSPPPAGP